MLATFLTWQERQSLRDRGLRPDEVAKHSQVTVPRVNKLSVNYRTHNGILGAASEIVSLLLRYFPHSVHGEHSHSVIRLFLTTAGAFLINRSTRSRRTRDISTAPYPLCSPTLPKTTWRCCSSGRIRRIARLSSARTRCGGSSRVPPLHLSCISAASLLHLRCISAASSLRLARWCWSAIRRPSPTCHPSSSPPSCSPSSRPRDSSATRSRLT